MYTTHLESFDELRARTLERWDGLLARGIMVLVRQSTVKQAREYVHSAQFQFRQVQVAARFGIRDEDITVVDLRGESGSRPERRKLFRVAADVIERGGCGVLMLADHNRLGRNVHDAARVFSAMQRHRGVIIVDGQLLDPCDPGDLKTLYDMAVAAEMENRSRAAYQTKIKRELSGRGGYRYQLPSGMVWASPHDPAYVKAMEHAGLSDWVADALRALERGDAYTARTTVSRFKEDHRLAGHTLLPMPFPDADVYRSITLRFQWLVEEGSLTGLMRRVEEDAAWPVAGKYPSTRSSAWRPSSSVRWRPWWPNQLRIWFQRPALYGRYAITWRQHSKISESVIMEAASARRSHA
ncbi:hypothetical protein rosag_47870 [Roseisolibacter agri]|uniref:Resolvase/invertase-type recombinase catalytic domain-containing protein n=1 Tax=Roseisolibacter agri TaxID=2014610 RepID=A0AA37VGC0_9BACT|nr:hypothetical protein rosag_47870 [Roseisolibacter agri]